MRITLLLTWAACQAPTEPPPATPGAPEAPTALSITWSTRIESVAEVSFDPAPGSTSSFVEYGNDGTFSSATPSVEGPMAILGLVGGTTYTARAVSLVDGDRREGPASDLIVPGPPADLPPLTVIADPGSVVAEGYVMMALTVVEGPDVRSWIVIIDGSGAPVWWYRDPDGMGVVSPTLGSTPSTLVWERTAQLDPKLPLTGVRIALDGTDLTEIPLAQGHHAVVEPEPGVMAWIARDNRENPDGVGWVTADRILEAPMDDPADAVVRTALFDDAWGGQLDQGCTHTQRAWTFDGKMPVFEWSHLNSIVYLPTEDAYFIHARWTDSIFLVDRSTSSLRWQLGGPGGDFALPDGSDPWGTYATSLLSHGHLSHAWPGGFVTFNNGSHLPDPVSGMAEYAYDASTFTVEEVFRYEDPLGRFVPVGGDARKLAGGHYLVSWSTEGELTEITEDGDVVWSAAVDPPFFTSRLRFLPDLYDL